MEFQKPDICNRTAVRHLVHRKLSIKVSVCITLLFSVGISHQATAETLQGAVKQALETNPELGAIRFNREAIDHELRAARGLKLPTLDARGELGRQRDSSKSRIIENSDGYRWRRELSIVASQRLFDGWDAMHEIARQKARVESARWRVNDTANSIALRAIQAYFEVLRAESVVKAARRNRRAIGGLLTRVRSRVRAGRGNISEQTEAGSRFANAKALVVEAKNRLADAIALYVAVVGNSPSRLKHARPASGLPANLASAVEQARTGAPSVIATGEDVRSARAAVGSAYSRLYPKLNLEVSTRHGKSVSSSGDRDLDHRAMVVARWNIFNGGIDRARIDEAKARANEASEIAANTQRIVVRETRVSWHAMVSARRRVPSLRRQLQLARATRSTYRQQFRSGKRRLLDLLDAQSEVFLADAVLQTEQFIAVFNSYRVLATMGILIDNLGLEHPPEGSTPVTHSVLDGGWYARVYHHSHQSRETHK